MRRLKATRLAVMMGAVVSLAVAMAIGALVLDGDGSTELTRATVPSTTEVPTTAVISTTIAVTTTVASTIPPTTTTAPRPTSPTTTSRRRSAPVVTPPASYTIPGPPVANPDTYGDMHWPQTYALHPLENDTGYKLMLVSLGPYTGGAMVTMKSTAIWFQPYETGCRTESFTYTAADRSGTGQRVSSTITVSYNC
jgi:hypothetical protein